MGVVSPELGVVSPGVGVVSTEVEANGEEDTDRWEPGSVSNGEDLKCPPLSVPQEDLKWAPASIEERKLTPSGRRCKQFSNTSKIPVNQPSSLILNNKWSCFFIVEAQVKTFGVVFVEHRMGCACSQLVQCEFTE